MTCTNGEVVLPPLSTVGGGLAEHFHQRRLSGQGQARALEHLQDQADVPQADRGVLDAGLGQGPVGEPDHLAVGERPRVADPGRRSTITSQIAPWVHRTTFVSSCGAA